MSSRLCIAVYRPYASFHEGRYTISRVLKLSSPSDQYMIGRVRETTDGLSYEMREPDVGSYAHVGYPITDRDIEAIKKGVEWHKAQTKHDVVNLIWVEGITS